MATVNLTHLDWHRTSENGSLPGSLYKAYEETPQGRFHYKLSSMSGMKVTGHESINEVIVSRLLDILNIEHTQYVLMDAIVSIKGNKFATTLCKSQDFKKLNETSLPLEEMYAMHSTTVSVYNFCHKIGIGDSIDTQILVDFLINNTDRHGWNTEILDNGSSLRMAPIFDSGTSFIHAYKNDISVIPYIDVMYDYPANNFIGTESLYRNLELIQNPILVSPLTEKRKSSIFYGLSKYISRAHIDKIWEMIWRRYCYVRDQKILLERSQDAENTRYFDV